jgi:hypothetical protein
MKEKSANQSSTSRAAAHVNKSLSRGISFPAPIHTSPAQLEGEAKSSIVQPPVNDRSSEVPDLPAALVKTLSDAKGDESLRENALKLLFEYLKAANIIEMPPGYDGPPIEVELFFKASTGAGKAAFTQYVSVGKKAQVALHVFSSIFNGSVASIYSTIRHELIHAAQQTQSANDDDTEKEDSYIFGFEKLDVTVSKKLLHPLQEIETHVWELVHALETGIANDPAYYNETENFLKSYTDNAIKYISGARTPVAVVSPFAGYIHKAVEHLRTVPLGDELADKLEKAYDDKIATKSSIGGRISVEKDKQKRKDGKKSSKATDEFTPPQGIKKTGKKK